MFKYEWHLMVHGITKSLYLKQKLQFMDHQVNIQDFSKPLAVFPEWILNLQPLSHFFCFYPTNTRCVLHVETTWKWSFLRPFNVAYMCCVCRVHPNEKYYQFLYVNNYRYHYYHLILKNNLGKQWRALLKQVHNSSSLSYLSTVAGQLYLKRVSGTAVFLWILRNF